MAHKKATSLTRELLAKAGQADLTATIEEAKARYCKDFDRRYAQFEAQLEKLAGPVGARDERIRSLDDVNARVTARCDAPAVNVNALEAAKRDVEAAKQAADDKHDPQTAVVRFLDATQRAEREAVAQKIAGLLPKLGREPRPANEPDPSSAA